MRLAGLYLDVAKFSAAEKITVLISALTTGLLMLALGMGVLMFCTLCLVHLLARVMPIYIVYIIIAALLAMLAAIIYLMRTSLIVNPVARFVSRLFLNPPKSDKNG